MFKRLFFGILYFLMLSSYTYAENLKVVFLNPGYPEENATGDFWLNVTRFMDASAEDLGIELVTIYGHRNHVLTKQLARRVISQKPDYVVLVNEKGVALDIIKRIAHHKIPVFLLLNNLNELDLRQLTALERSYIQGSLIPNNRLVGRQLMHDLLQIHNNSESKSREHESIHQPINLLALQGDHTTLASVERNKGMLETLSKHTNVYLIDSSATNWSKQKAYQKVKGLLHRQPIDIIWAANDAMAFGAKQAVMELGINPEQNTIIGGINWDIGDAYYPIDVSYGGHVVLGGFALVMLKDIHQNMLNDESKDQVINIFESSTSSSYQLFKQQLMSNEFDNYDFSQLLKSVDNQRAFTIGGLVSTLSH